MNISIAQLRTNFAIAVLRLKYAKANELRWRMLLAQTFVNPRIGVNRSADNEVVMICKETYTIDKDMNKVANVFNRLKAECPNDTIDSLVKFNPVLEKATYDALSEQAKQIFAEVLTIKPGLPSISVKGIEE